MSKKKKKEVLHIYTRVSTKGQSEKGYSLKVQRQKGIEVSKKLGMDYKVWNEGGQSSYRDDLLNRPKMMNLLDDVSRGIVKHIYVTDFDRLSRKKGSWYIIHRDFTRFGVTTYVGEGSKYDLDNIYDELFFNIFSSISQFDNQQRSGRFFRSRVRKFIDGYFVTSTVNFGYEKYEKGKGKKLRVHPTNGKIVKKVYDMFYKGGTIKEIQDYLYTNKIKSPRNNDEWGQQGIINLLQNQMYIGINTFTDRKTNTTYEQKVPSVVTDKVWYGVQSRFVDYFELTRQKNRQKHEYLLTSILRCGVCGHLMRGLTNPKVHKHLYYCGNKEERWRSRNHLDKCDKKMSKSVNIDRLDDLVWNEIITTLRDSNIIREKMKKQILTKKGLDGEELVKQQLKEKKKEKMDYLKERNSFIRRQSKLVEMYSKGMIEDKDFEKSTIEIEKQTTRLSGLMEETDIFLSKLNESKTWIEWFKIYMSQVDVWEKLKSIEQKKNILKTYVSKILVSYDEDDLVHKVQMFLRLPLFDDKYTHHNKGERNTKGQYVPREVTIEDGSNSKTMYLQKTKVGRKKKILSVK